MSFPTPSDSDLIQIYMFNCITDLTEWFSHNYISLNMTITDTIIFCRPSSSLSIIHHFLLYLPPSQSIIILGFTITSHIDYSAHINNMSTLNQLSQLFYRKAGIHCHVNSTSISLFKIKLYVNFKTIVIRYILSFVLYLYLLLFFI